MKSNVFALLLLAVMAVGCGQGKKAESFSALPFPEVIPPGMMTDPQDRAEYIAEHYWDAVTDPSREYPSDSLLLSGVLRTDVEQKFADWLSVLDMIPFQKAEKAVSRLYARILACGSNDSISDMLLSFSELSYKYFYDPNSPLRNEDYYHVFVSRLSKHPGLSSEMRDRYEYYSTMTSLNRTGTIASDFRFSDKNGIIRTLHSIKAPLTLLFFSNPGCEACMDIINVLKGHEKIASMIAAGELAVLNIYIDEDIRAWRDYMSVYPDEWYNGFDPDLIIRNENLYHVRAIPSLYLLDEEKRVILKDAPENKVFGLLSSR